MTADPNFTYMYDAWNHLVEVRGRGDGALTARYKYDGVKRRIAKVLPAGGNWDRTDYYHDNSWQVLEERRGTASDANAATAAKVQYVWLARYTDAAVCRDRDAAGDSALEDRLYYLTDAQTNVTAVVDGTAGSGTFGQVVERCFSEIRDDKYTYDIRLRTNAPDASALLLSSCSAKTQGNRKFPMRQLLTDRYRIGRGTMVIGGRGGIFSGSWVSGPSGRVMLAGLYPLHGAGTMF